MRRKALAVLASVLFLVTASASASQASIPDASGLINGCYKTADLAAGTLYVIDSAASCPSGFTSLQWSNGIPGAWQTPTLGTGCASIDIDSDTVTETVKYRIEGDAVRIKGVVNSCSNASPVVFVLPSGFRPAQWRLANGSNMSVYPTGNVTFSGASAGQTLFLDGSFPLS